MDARRRGEFERLPAGVNRSVRRRMYFNRSPYWDDPCGWAWDKLRVRLVDYQADIAQSVAQNRLTAVPSCNGAGKSFLAAILICWWLDTRPIDDLFVVWTAPTFQQVRGVVGRYVRALLKRLDIGVTLNGDMELKTADGTLVGWGRKPSDYNEEAFSGIHAGNVLIIVDEATGVRQTIWNALRSFMTGGDPHLLAIGNPNSPSSYFREVVHNPKLGYLIRRIDALRVPTMTRAAVAPYPELAAVFDAEGIPYAAPDQYPAAVLANLTQPRLVWEWLLEWGTEHPYWSSKVRGVFPSISERAVFTPQMIEDAIALEIVPREHQEGWYAADIAEEGGDETVIYRNQGGRIRLVHQARFTANTMEHVGVIRALLDTHARTVPIWIDDNGVGKGVADRLRELEYPAISHKGSRSPLDPDYRNRRAEVYYTLANAMRANLIDIALADTTLAWQLLDIRWKPNSDNKIQLETRQEREKRGAKSPDRADAVAIIASAPSAAMLLDEEERMDGQYHREQDNGGIELDASLFDRPL